MHITSKIIYLFHVFLHALHGPLYVQLTLPTYYKAEHDILLTKEAQKLWYSLLQIQTVQAHTQDPFLLKILVHRVNFKRIKI